jgi:hypothetical protein
MKLSVCLATGVAIALAVNVGTLAVLVAGAAGAIALGALIVRD